MFVINWMLMLITKSGKANKHLWSCAKSAYFFSTTFIESKILRCKKKLNFNFTLLYFHNEKKKKIKMYKIFKLIITYYFCLDCPFFLLYITSWTKELCRKLSRRKKYWNWYNNKFLTNSKQKIIIKTKWFTWLKKSR